jgi:CHAD domain-containing protein
MATNSEGPLAAYASAQVDAIRQGEDGLRAADMDAIHDTRVAARRLRSTLRAFRAEVEWIDIERVERLREELAWFGGLLGAVRDSQVMTEHLTATLAAEPPELVIGPVVARVNAALAAQTAAAHRELAAAIGDERYRDLLSVADDVIHTELTRPPTVAALRARVDRTLRRARRLLAAADTGPDRDMRLHEARKAYKRARYAVEVLRPIDGKRADRLARRIAAIQDVLGAHQDTVVLRVMLRDLGMRAFLDRENSFTYGLLHARQAEQASRHRAALSATARRANRKRLRRWLAA